MKNLLILASIAVLGLSSCKKDWMEKVTPATNTQEVSKFSELKVQENFDWKTSKEYNLSVRGLETISPVQGTMIVSSDDGKIIFYQGLHKMNENFNSKFMVPVHIKGLTISFGSITKNFSTLNKQIQFDYLTEATAE
jgi:hypothetical protein